MNFKIILIFIGYIILVIIIDSKSSKNVQKLIAKILSFYMGIKLKNSFKDN